MQKRFICLPVLFMFFSFLSGCKDSSTQQVSREQLELQKKTLELKERELALEEKKLEQAAGPKETKRVEKSEQRASGSAFYMINVAAVQSESDARLKVQQVRNAGYQADYLWIPDYASLSGAKMYSVYIGPYSTQAACEAATEQYRINHPEAYGLLVSQDRKRVQINGVGKVTVTYK